MKLLLRILPFSASLIPMLALAQFGKVDSFFSNILLFINSKLVPLVFALAFLFFIWGIFKYFIFGSSDETSREEGRQFMLWGIIGFVVMLSVWGIVTALSSGLGFNQENLQNIPNVPRSN